jgi:hypothetical protein
LTDLDLVVIRQGEFSEFLLRRADVAIALLELLVAKIRSATDRELEFSTAPSTPVPPRSLPKPTDGSARRTYVPSVARHAT